MNGTTAIIDHHESPSCIEGSLDAISRACSDVGMRHMLSYGVTDRWDHGRIRAAVPRSSGMTDAARRGLEENARYIDSGRPAMVGVHASFTCSDETLEAAADLAHRKNIGVHIHVAEGPDDRDAGERLEHLAEDNWLLVHAVHLDRPLRGTIAHNPRSNMNNGVGYATPADKPNTVILGTDGIGADMLEEFRLAYVRHREADLGATPETAWSWLNSGSEFFPEVLDDKVEWSYPHVDSAWHVAFTPGTRVEKVTVDNEVVVDQGKPTKFDMEEIRRKAAEAALRLHERL
jgi:cytosine/adenosine deaminase-related metal-dependent hydrolase